MLPKERTISIMASYLQHMPDIVLLKVFNYLNTDDLLHLSECCERFQYLCSEKLIVRFSSFEGCYHVKEEDFKKYIKKSCQWIQALDLNHCYWWPPKLINWAIGKCKDLRALHVLECRIKVTNLVSLVSALPKLTKLSFSVQSINDLRTDVFNPCSSVLKNLKSLHVYYSSRELSLLHFLGEQSTMLDHCESIEEIFIGSAGMAIPELYRPLITYPQNFVNLKVMGITNNIHAGAQMLYYGTLSQIPNSDLHFKTLIMPNVNFPEFMQRSEYRDCLCHMESLHHLDIYGSKVSFPMEVIDIKRAVELRHMSLGASRISGPQLKYIANHCSKLTSINLFNCDNLFRGKPVYQGIEALFQCCVHMKHFNIAGEHHHFHDMVDGLKVLDHIKGLRSLSISTCMLCEDKNQKPGKRIMSCRGGGMAPKRRCIQQPPSSSSPTTRGRSSSEEDSSSPEPSTSTGHRVSHVQAAHSTTILDRLIDNNRDLRTLEILAANLTSLVHQNKYVSPKKQPNFEPCTETRLVRDIGCIQHLSRLENLTLMGLPGLCSGAGLCSIMKGCSSIKSLHIGYLGAAFSGGSFTEALRHMNNLEDLRIEQPNLLLKSSFFECVSRCQKLQRLCIFAKHSTFQGSDVSKLVEQLPLLVVLQIFAGGALNTCKNIVTTLNKKYHKSRPALSVFIYPVLHEGITATMSQIPAKHFEEVTRFCSKVAAFPPGMRI